jgi:hypothetical protein
VSADTIELGWLVNVLGRHLETLPDARLLTAERPGRCGIEVPPNRCAKFARCAAPMHGGDDDARPHQDSQAAAREIGEDR